MGRSRRCGGHRGAYVDGAAMRIPTSRTLAVLALFALFLAGCAAGDARFSQDAPAGFWAGLWHGMISVVAFFVGLFVDGVQVYERHNSGPWYDAGFLIGVIAIWGGGSHQAGRRRRSREEDKEWEEIGRKVETKLKRRLRQWAEAEPDEEWNVVEAKAEAKLKRRLRAWAEEDERRTPSDPPPPPASASD